MSDLVARAGQLFDEGNRRRNGGDVAGALHCFEQALAVLPQFVEAMVNLAHLRELTGAAADAERLYRAALALRPQLLQVYLNLGALLVRARRLEDAEQLYRQALTLAPDSPRVWSALGMLMACLQRDAEAEQCCRHALGLDPTHANARLNLSYVLLRRGAMEEGWACYEARLHAGQLAALFTCPLWNGEDLAGKAVLISFDAGYGDMIQFARYASVLKARGARRVDVLCQPDMAPLLTTLDGADNVLAYGDATAALAAAADWDYWCPAMGLPHRCGTRPDTIPAAASYLHADPARIAHWAPRLPATGFKVGLAWKGNPRFENDAARSLPSLATLAPLAAVDGISFVSLQKGPGEDEHGLGPLPLAPLGRDCADFADSAAIIGGLDLVISVDSAVAHLAGSLGKPCWLLLPDYRCDWRWLTGRSDTPWYPSLRLFRQPPGGGWNDVISAVAAALKTTRHL